jgi:hypothetical protein
MPIPGLRSPHEKVGGIVFFGRMLDKIRLQQAGKLPPGYNLGDQNPNFFDGRSTRFLRVSYDALRGYVLAGATDEQALEWCFQHGRRPNDEEITMFNDFLRKRGWNDDASTLLEQRKREFGFADRNDIQTSFDLQDADEGRPLRRYT